MKNVNSAIKNLLPKNLQEIYPDSQFEKLLFELPMIAWRLGFGPLLGRYLMVITHTGRKTGVSRRTAVEYHTMNGMKYIPCAFGVKAQWYRNILANPRVTIQTDDGTENMVAVRVNDDNELIYIIETILSKNPTMMNWYLNSLGIKPTQKEILDHKKELIFLRFDPTSDPTPRGLEVDLAWIWPLILAFTILRRPKRKKRK